MKVVRFLLGLILLAVGISILIAFMQDETEATTPSPSGASGKPLHIDFSRPVYTTDHAAICPLTLLWDRRADRDAGAIIDAMTSIFDRSEKLKRLGCEEWKEGIRVEATPMDDSSLVLLRIDGDTDSSAFTLRWELENHPGDARLSVTRAADVNKRPASDWTPPLAAMPRDDSHSDPSASAVTSDQAGRNAIQNNAVAQGWGDSPDAIVCADIASVQDQYKRFQAAGSSAPLSSDCVAIKPGTQIHAEKNGDDTTVVVILSSGSLFIGKTMPQMVAMM